MVRRLITRARRERAAKLARDRTARDLCVECGSPVGEGLIRLGALRCHDCGDRIRSLPESDLASRSG